MAWAQNPLADATDTLVAQLVYAFPPLMFLRRIKADGILVILEGSCLASSLLVCRPGAPGQQCPSGTASQRGSTVPKADLPSCFTFDGLAVESQVQKNRGLPGSVVPTLLKAIKSTFS